MSITLYMVHGLFAAMSFLGFGALPLMPDSAAVANVRIDVCIVQIPAASESPGDGTAESDEPTSRPDVVEIKPAQNAAAGSMQVELLRDGSLVQVGGRRFVVANAKLNPVEGDAAGANATDVIAAPSIRVNVGEKAAITIGQAVSYMRKLDNGDLRLVVEQDCVEGVVIEALVSDVKDGLIHLDSLSVALNTVERRERIDGVPFDVGRPVIQTRQVSCSLRMAEGNTAVVPLPVGPTQGSVILLLISMHEEKVVRDAQ